MSGELYNSLPGAGEDQEALTVLVVEDDRSVQEGLAMFLEDEGFNVVSAYDADEGVRVVDEYLDSGRTIHAALLDNRMPKGTGKDVGRHLVEKERAVERERNISLGHAAIVGISGTETITDEELGVGPEERGRVQNYAKPFNKGVNYLTSLIRETIDQTVA